MVHIENGTLFPVPDRKLTEQRVSDFFKTEFPSALRASGQTISDIQSPNYNGMPKGQPVGNPTENKIARRLIAEQVVKETLNAVKRCSPYSEKLLRMLYLQAFNRADWEVEALSGYQHTQYYYYKNKALDEFADAYLLDDLHVYK